MTNRPRTTAPCELTKLSQAERNQWNRTLRQAGLSMSRGEPPRVSKKDRRQVVISMDATKLELAAVVIPEDTDPEIATTFLAAQRLPCGGNGTSLHHDCRQSSTRTDAVEGNVEAEDDNSVSDSTVELVDEPMDQYPCRTILVSERCRHVAPAPVQPVSAGIRWAAAIFECDEKAAELRLQSAQALLCKRRD